MVGAIEILKSESTKAETSKVSLSTISESAYNTDDDLCKETTEAWRLRGVLCSTEICLGFVTAVRSLKMVNYSYSADVWANFSFFRLTE
jgi:hypothetical protein